MKQARQLLMLAICCLCSMALTAQTYEVNLANISEINLTLNDECQGLVIPSMVLAGDYDVDGDGEIPGPELFKITVLDGTPQNGPIVDGCGEFQYRVEAMGEVQVTPALSGFENADLSFFTEADPFFGDIGTVTVANDDEVTFVAGEGDFLPISFITVLVMSFDEAGEASFDYEFTNNDPGLDFGAILTSFEGELIEFIEDFNPGSFSGTADVDVLPGYSIEVGIVVGTDGFGGQPDPSEFTLTNYEFDPIDIINPVVGFTTSWGIVNAEDKTSPEAVRVPDDVQLLCVDIEDNDSSTLPTDVSRCYYVNASTGATIAGTMDAELRARLLAGGTSPLVPLFTDGCSELLKVCVNDVVVYDPEDPQCETVVLTRTFTASEDDTCPSAAGEENAPAVASYVIEFIRPSLDDLSDDNIEDVVNYERCGDASEAYPAPRPQDFPFLEIAGRTFPLMDGEAVCNIGVTYADGEAIVTCPFTYKFVRTYTVIDWCDPSDVRTFTQVVKVGDTTAPVFYGPTQDRDFDGDIEDDLIYSTNAGNQCAAYIRLDAAGVRAVDNCSANVSITASIYPGGDLAATPIGAFVVDPNDGDAEITSPIPVGCHLLRYTSTDQCGNVTISDYDFCVEDGTAPVAICEDGLNVGISSGSASGGVSTGIAILTPEMIDNGSYDDCSGVTLAIARVNAANIATEVYDQELVLTCADLGIVRVGLRVTDALGNENFCWLDVLVEDKFAPTCIPPSPVTLSCIEYNATLPADITESTVDERNAIFGSAAGIDNCEVTITEVISGDVNSCGVGSFTRTFTATDGEGFTNTNNCRQRITVYGIHDYQLIFPTDEAGDCAEVPEFAGVTANELACDLITTTADVDTLRTLEAGEECFKLRITYDVINWCEYNTLGQPYLIPRDGDGIRNPETQLLYLNVVPFDLNPQDDDDLLTTADDIAFLSRFSDRNYNPSAPQNDMLVDDGDDNDGSDDDNGNDNNDDEAYAADNSRGHFRYIQFVKIYDDVAPTIDADAPADCFAGNSAECEADLTLTFVAADECSDAVVGIELDANYVAADGFSPDNAAALGIGVSLTNDGDNYTISATNVPVGNHAIRIRASDGCGNFDVEILEFCVVGDKAPTPICIQTLTVTLMPDGQGGGMAEIWASDFIASDVEDCFGNLIDKYSIYTEEDAIVAGFAPAAGDLGIQFDCDVVDQDVPVRVYAIANNGTADYCSVIVQVQAFQDGVCDPDGGNILSGAISTSSNEAMEGVDVTITGANDMDVTVTTNVNGEFAFTSLQEGADYTVQPEYNVAVDLQIVKTSDVVKIASVILGAEDFDSPYDYLAADANRSQTLDVLDMVAIQRVILGLDDNFVHGQTWGFVPADISVANPFAETFPGVYNVNDMAGNELEADFVTFAYGNVVGNGRSASTLKVEDVQLEAGQTHTMVIEGAELAGFQGTFELAAGLELVSADYTGEGAVNLNRAAEGLVAVALRGEASLSLEVRATEAALLSDVVALTDAITVREGVSLNGAGGNLSLSFSNLAVAGLGNSLEQNTPNPVADVTKITYNLATASQVTLNIQDVQGRTVMVRDLEGVAGANVVTLNVSELNGASGVLTYTVTAGDFSATKKMVVVR